jgi:hypothetical protein
MLALEHVTISELQDLLNALQLPTETRVTVTFEENDTAIKALKRQKAIIAMKRLRGSGNGKLVATLLKEREKDALS